ncbi:AMP-binding protein [bacterium]|nr:AMP-binding protein [bacterium]
MVSLEEMLENSLAVRPDGIALIFKGETMTYARLHERIDMFACRLSELGVSPGERLGILSENSPIFIIAFWAAIKAGAAVIPIDTRHKEEEIRFILTDSNTKNLFVSDRYFQKAERAVSALNGFGDLITGVYPDGITCQRKHSCRFLSPRSMKTGQYFRDKPSCPFGAAMKDENKFNEVYFRDKPSCRFAAPRIMKINKEVYFRDKIPKTGEEAEAVYIYTSGSTGHPKGIIRSRRNLVSEAENVVTTEKITRDDRILGVLPFFHSYGLGHCLLASIRSGASLVLMDGFRPHEAIDVIRKTEVTIFPGVPYMYDILANTYMRTQAGLSSLRLCISAGAPLSLDLARHFRERFGIVINQHYGSTEAGAVSINKSKELEKNVASVGQAMANVEIKIVDDKGFDLGEGRAGEIIVKSHAVAKEYHNSPLLTSAAFKNGWFYTGDLGKKDRDGFLYITGRRKDMINVAGLKVEPAEVEEILKGFHKIREAVVISVRDESTGESVKAVVVAKEECSEEEVIDFCRARLADYKVPCQVEFRESLPRSSTGKILRGKI